MTSHSKVHFLRALYRPGKWLWVDSNGTDGKPTFRRRVNLSWLSAICIRFGEIAAWSRKSLTTFKQNLTFVEKRPITDKFSKMFSERIHGDIDPCFVCKFREISPTESPWNRAFLTRQKILLALASARIAPKICHGQLETIYSECPKFHPNPFASGGVIAGRMNIVEMRHKVFPILGVAFAESKALTARYPFITP